MPTGTQSIAQHLPQVRGTTPGAYVKVGPNGHSTNIAKAPKTIIAFAANTFQHCLQSPALLQALKVELNTITTAPGHNLLNERDVSRAAAVYLVHDVTLIVEKGLLPQLHISVDNFSCVGLTRPDIEFVVNDKTVLILEYKRT